MSSVFLQTLRYDGAPGLSRCASATYPVAMSKRPNIILIVTDQHRADHLGCYGNRTVRTPNIDRLAATGSRFDRFHVASPVRMPNRASLMTGRMPSLHGVRHNGIPLSTEHVTFVELLAAAGYRTGLIGKSHLQNFTGAPPTRDFPARPGLVPPPPELREADRRVRRNAALAVNDLVQPVQWDSHAACGFNLGQSGRAQKLLEQHLARRRRGAPQIEH